MIITSQKLGIGRGRLRKFAAQSANGKHSMTITLDYESAVDMSWDIDQLEAILKEDLGGNPPKPPVVK